MSWHVGNAEQDGAATRGWFVGHFLGAGAGVRASQDVEIKWAHHPAGERRAALVTEETRTTVSLLISGRWRVALSTGEHVLSRPGDYVMWGPGVDHTWEALEDSLVVSIRWPSQASPGDSG